MIKKTQMSKVAQSWRLLGRLLGPLLKPGLSLIKNVIKPLPKSVLTPSRLTAAASTTDPVIQKWINCSGTTIVIISSEEMESIMNKIKSFEESGLLIKCVSENIRNGAKEKSGFLSMLLDKLGASLLAYLLPGKVLSKLVRN